MGSSRSTLSRSSEGPVRLFVKVTGEDHPKACTGRRLLRLGWATEWSADRTTGPSPLLLDPRAPTILGPEDRVAARRGGLLVVDCSWNRLSERGGLDPLATGSHHLARRRLPWLLAGNPQHYGRLGQLNTAEAFAGALWILGESELATRVAETFAGGPGFLQLNEQPLAAYVRAHSAAELRAAEREFF